MSYQRQDKNTIINHVVKHAADIMEAKAEFHEILAKVLRESGKPDEIRSAGLLEAENEKTRAAVEHMRTCGGCWA